MSTMKSHKKHTKNRLSSLIQSLTRMPKQQRNAQPTAQNLSSIHCEALEPRVLLSGDTSLLSMNLAGAINTANEVTSYELNLDAPTRVVFDTQTADAALSWQLVDAQNHLVAEQSLMSDAVLQLGAGHYQINIMGANGHTGSYQLRIADGIAANSLTIDQPTTGTLAGGMYSQLYKFDANADQQFKLLAQGVTGGAVNWRLIDPTGQEAVSSRSLTTDYGQFLLEKTGSYWLLVEGQSSSADPITFAFTLQSAASSPIIYADSQYLKAAFNTAGREDLLEVSHNQAGETVVRQLLATGTGYQSGIVTVLGTWNVDNSYLIGDLNGDGKSDLVEIRRQADGTTVANAWRMGASGFDALSSSNLGIMNSTNRYYLADTTGDKKADLIVKSWPGLATAIPVSRSGKGMASSLASRVMWMSRKNTSMAS